MVFQRINIRQVPREASGLGFQHLPRDLANVNTWKTMFDSYSEVRGDVLRSLHDIEPCFLLESLGVYWDLEK